MKHHHYNIRSRMKAQRRLMRRRNYGRTLKAVLTVALFFQITAYNAKAIGIGGVSGYAVKHTIEDYVTEPPWIRAKLLGSQSNPTTGTLPPEAPETLPNPAADSSVSDPVQNAETNNSLSAPDDTKQTPVDTIQVPVVIHITSHVSDTETGSDRNGDAANENDRYSADMVRILEDVERHLRVIAEKQTESSGWDADRFIALIQTLLTVLIPLGIHWNEQRINKQANSEESVAV